MGHSLVAHWPWVVPLNAFLADHSLSLLSFAMHIICLSFPKEVFINRFDLVVSGFSWIVARENCRSRRSLYEPIRPR